MISAFIKHFLAKLLFIPWFLLIAAPLFFIGWWLKDHEEASRILTWVIGPLVVLALLASGWLGHTTAHYLVDETESFYGAIKRTIYDARFHLEFLPGIGVLFAPDEDKAHPDDD